MFARLVAISFAFLLPTVSQSAADPKQYLGPWWLIDCSYDRDVFVADKRETLKPPKLSGFQKLLAAGQPKTERPKSLNHPSFWFLEFVPDPFANNELRIRARYYEHDPNKTPVHSYSETDMVALMPDGSMAIRFPEKFSVESVTLEKKQRLDITLASAPWSAEYLRVTAFTSTTFIRTRQGVEVDVSGPSRGVFDMLINIRARNDFNNRTFYPETRAEWFKRLKTERPSDVCLLKGPLE